MEARGRLFDPRFGGGWNKGQQCVREGWKEKENSERRRDGGDREGLWKVGKKDNGGRNEEKECEIRKRKQV